MITEDYVSFEIAKLLKEKGFYTPYCYSYYFPELKSNTPCISNRVIPKDTDKYLAPTLQMALKYLREVHNMNIIFDMIPLNEDSYVLWTFNVYCNKNYKIVWGTKQPKYNTYEETAEAAIKYCLTTLI